MIQPGTILIDKDVPRPECFKLDDHTPSNEWGAVRSTLSSKEREKELTRTGWTFFFMATLRAKAFGFDRTKTSSAAVERFISKVKLLRCNCLEIDRVEERSFLGIPYINLFGHARHIQIGVTFAPTANRLQN